MRKLLSIILIITMVMAVPVTGTATGIQQWETLASVDFESFNAGVKPNSVYYKNNTSNRLVVNEGYTGSRGVVITGTDGNWSQNRIMNNSNNTDFSSIYSGELVKGETYRWSAWVKLYDDGSYTLPQNPTAYIAGYAYYDKATRVYESGIESKTIYNNKWTQLTFEFTMDTSPCVTCAIVADGSMKLLVDDYKIEHLKKNYADVGLYSNDSNKATTTFTNGSYNIKANITKNISGQLDVLVVGAAYYEERLVQANTCVRTIQTNTANIELAVEFKKSVQYDYFKMFVFDKATLTPLCEAVTCEMVEKLAPELPEITQTEEENLPDGEIILSESAIFTSGSVSDYFDTYDETATLSSGLATVTYSAQTDRTLPFSEKISVNVPRYFSSDGYTKITVMPNDNITKGDYLLLSFYAQVLYSEQDNGTGIIGFKLQNNNSELNYPNSINQSFTLTPEWHKYNIPIIARYDHDAGGYSLIIRLSGTVQTIELGGFSLVNYKNSVNYSDLPVTQYNSYDGMEEDANWRAAADARIEQYRMGDITVNVVDKDGAPINNASVSLDMTKHEFDFGGTVWNSIDDTNQTEYQKVVENFNTVVVGNNLKWKHWVKDSKKQDVMALLEWAKENGIDVRGHCLIWDSSTHRPDEYVDLEPDAALEAFEKHISDIVGATKDYIYEWDVLNEPVTNHGVFDFYEQDYSLYKNWFDLARKANPDAKLYINDASALGVNTNNYRSLKNILENMNDAGVDYDAIGIEGHFSAPCSIESFYNQLCELAEYGKELKITEFDVNCSEAVKARFSRDMLKIAFSHPSVNGFLMWTWRPTMDENTSGTDYARKIMYDSDFNITPTGEQLRWLIFNEWWTNEHGKTNENGAFDARGFFGDYNVTVEYNGTVTEQAVNVSSNGTNEFTIVIGD